VSGKKIPLEIRFWKKIDKNGQIPAHKPELGPCWIWLGCKNDKGYGQISVNQEMAYAHRVAYEMLVGPIPDGLTLDHLCRNTGCPNPSHTEPVTHRVNCLRGISPWAKEAKQTHCIHGHLFDLANTYVSKLGKRHCRKCHAIRASGYYHSRL